ncbi:hypothetical protein OGAPHI_005126 [Ogataea philodendri]|uniref:Uncharacterized protein n=1 Tax=Ogataea philodendri TaxID=1378263 RepID=A0A9P8T312_9ASCO|nr:uncharacterized protein OGAPHI_005126 [Ogataea philodendri]KAH3663724.1 hypothetical protein OGAPHI_005126 [Ogataea philodendri]
MEISRRARLSVHSGQCCDVNVQSGCSVDQTSVYSIVAVPTSAVVVIRTNVQKIAPRAINVHNKRLIVVTCQTDQAALCNLDVEVRVPVEHQAIELEPEQRSVGDPGVDVNSIREPRPGSH